MLNPPEQSKYAIFVIYNANLNPGGFASTELCVNGKRQGLFISRLLNRINLYTGLKNLNTQNMCYLTDKINTELIFMKIYSWNVTYIYRTPWCVNWHLKHKILYTMWTKIIKNINKRTCNKLTVPWLGT